MKEYIVTFTIKRNRQEYHRQQIIAAKNAKEARQLFDKLWYEDHKCMDRIPHPFRIKVTLVK